MTDSDYSDSDSNVSSVCSEYSDSENEIEIESEEEDEISGDEDDDSITATEENKKKFVAKNGKSTIDSQIIKHKLHNKNKLHANSPATSLRS